MLIKNSRAVFYDVNLLCKYIRAHNVRLHSHLGI